MGIKGEMKMEITKQGIKEAAKEGQQVLSEWLGRWMRTEIQDIPTERFDVLLEAIILRHCEAVSPPTGRRVRLPETVTGDYPFGSTTIAPAGEYEAHLNPQGAVSVVATDGKLLGVKPGEFEWVEAVSPAAPQGDHFQNLRSESREIKPETVGSPEEIRRDALVTFGLWSGSPAAPPQELQRAWEAGRDAAADQVLKVMTPMHILKRIKEGLGSLDAICYAALTACGEAIQRLTYPGSASSAAPQSTVRKDIASLRELVTPEMKQRIDTWRKEKEEEKVCSLCGGSGVVKRAD